MNERDDLTADERELLRGQGVSFEALQARHADCPRLEVVLASQSGVLPAETVQMVAAHLKDCTFCQILLQDFASEELTTATTEEARRISERVHAADKSEAKKVKASGGLLSIWLWRAIPVMALAGVAITVFFWMRPHQSATPIVQRTATTPPGVGILSSLSWEKLPIQLQVGSLLVWRGEPRTAQERYASELAPALGLYKEDKFAEAADRLTKVTSDFPDGVEGQLYLGVSLLKLERNAEAVRPLQAAQKLGPQPFQDEASWYLALAYQRTQDRVGTVIELRKLCQGKSGYARRACTVATALATP